MEDLPLEEQLNRSFNEQEKKEEKALELEKLIKSYRGAAALINLVLILFAKSYQLPVLLLAQ